MSAHPVRDRDGRQLGMVMELDGGRWAWWRGTAPVPLHWSDSRQEAVAALLESYVPPAAPEPCGLAQQSHPGAALPQPTATSDDAGAGAAAPVHLTAVTR